MPSLLVLAAGLGSRYGGLKQIDPVGPSGETLLDYAVFDALRAGFDRVVFVIREDFAEAFQAQVVAKYSRRMRTSVVFQSPALLPAGFTAPPDRQKPWGTGHAVWCAREAMVEGENFAVINADDFYGAGAFQALAAFFTRFGAPRSMTGKYLEGLQPTFFIVGFHLGKTLSENGGVSRGICEIDRGRLTSIVEQTNIQAAEVGPGRKYAAETVVSMNCWGFTSSLFALLEERLVAFLAAHRHEPKAEFYLPAAVSDLIVGEKIKVEVGETGDAWFGVTYKEDKAKVAAAIAGLTGRGVYPARLFP